MRRVNGNRSLKTKFLVLSNSSEFSDYWKLSLFFKADAYDRALLALDLTSVATVIEEEMTSDSDENDEFPIAAMSPLRWSSLEEVHGLGDSPTPEKMESIRKEEEKEEEKKEKKEKKEEKEEKEKEEKVKGVRRKGRSHSHLGITLTGSSLKDRKGRDESEESLATKRVTRIAEVCIYVYIRDRERKI